MSFVRPDQPDAPKNRPARPRDQRSSGAQGTRRAPDVSRTSATPRSDARGVAGSQRGSVGAPGGQRRGAPGAPRAAAGQVRGERPAVRQSGTARTASGRAGGASERVSTASGRATGSRPQNAAGSAPRRPRGSAGPASDNKSQSTRMRAQERQRRLAAEQLAQTRRRIIVLALILVAVLLVGLLAVYLLGNRSNEVASQQEHPTERWSPVACSPEGMKTTLEAPLIAPAGTPIDFTVTLENLSDKHPCFIDVGWSNVDISITTGTNAVVSTQTCGFGTENKQLLLDRSMNTSFVLTWPGGVGEEACSIPEASWSQPGSYQARLTFINNAAEPSQTAFVLE